MPSVDLIAVRDGGGPPGGPAFAGGAQHLVEANRRPGRGERLRRLLPGTAVSAVVHVFIAIAGLMIWRAMLHDLTAAEPISVEIVHSIPGEDDGSGKPGSNGGPAAPGTGQADAKAPDAKPPDTRPPDKAPDPKAPDKPPAPKPPAPKRSALDEALPAPDMGSASPPAPAPPVPPPAGAAGGRPGGTRVEPAPSLVAPPPEPKAAATQPDRPQVANTADGKVPTPLAPPPVKAPPVPAVLSAPDGDTSVPAPPPEAEADAKPDKPAVAGDPKAAAPPDPAAQLAAALPQNPFALPATFRAVMSGQGSSAGTQYKGAVFGALNHGRAAEVAQQAEQRGLRGQVIVRFTLDDAGALESLSILHSSGNPAVDQAAEAMVRGAAPFPPPPPGSPRVFTPALAFGG